MISVPKYLIGDAHPDGDFVWVVRTRNPVVLAMVEGRGLFGLRLHGWPVSAMGETTENKLLKIMSVMAEIFGQEVEELVGLPPVWDFVFDKRLTPPEYLFLDGVRNLEYSAVLDTKNMLIFEVSEEEDIFIAAAPLDDRGFSEDEINHAAYEAQKFLEWYFEVEDELNE